MLTLTSSDNSSISDGSSSTNNGPLQIYSVKKVSADTISVTGDNFSNKAQQAPILYDHTDVAWENGVLNTHQSGFSDMELIKRINEDPNTLWEKPSLGGGEINTGMRISRNRPGRYSESKAHYYAKGNNNFLGWPTAYGGSNVNSNSKKIYTAVWIKLPFDLQNYYAIPADDFNTGFIQGGEEEYGEPIQIEGVSEPGRIIAHRTDIGTLPQGWLFFEPPRGTKSRDMMGKKITGLESGAEVVFPSNFSNQKFDGNGFLNPRGKYMRLWSDDGGNGYRFSIANLGMSGTGSVVWANNFEYNNLIPQQWNLLETEIYLGDKTKNEEPSLNVYINGKIYLKSTPEWIKGIKQAADDKSDASGLTIALLGINDFMPVPFTVELDDIYLDKSFHRVMICDKATLEDIRKNKGHCELQNIKNWTNTQIEFKLHLGALDKQDNLYLYIFDSNSNSNNKGIEFTAN